MGSHLSNWAKFWLVGFGVSILLPLNLPALATTKVVNISLKTEENQSFVSLMQQAELTATNLINQEFERLSIVTEIGVTVSGRHNGQEVPLLSTKVSRPNWQAQPKIKLWTNYFTKAAVLLGFNPSQKPKPLAPQSTVNSRIIESDPGFRDD